jgi:hypothetical protein
MKSGIPTLRKGMTKENLPDFSDLGWEIIQTCVIYAESGKDKHCDENHMVFLLIERITGKYFPLLH